MKIKFKKLLSLVTIPVLATLLCVVYVYAADIYFVPGEKKDVWIEISEREGDSTTWTIDTATYWVEDENDVVVSAEASATVDGTRVYGLVDSTTWTVGSEYSIYIMWATDATAETSISPIKAIAGDDYL